MKASDSVPYSNITRLPRYYRFLSDLYKNGISRISSGKLAEIMGVTSSQIRQDFSSFGLSGQQGYGYNVSSVIDEIAKILGLNNNKTAILVGAGNLGMAIASWSYEDRAFTLIGAFDLNPELHGKQIGGTVVYDISALDEFCRKNHPDCAFICLPEKAVKETVKILTKRNVNYFWNFSHYDIKNEFPQAIVENVHLSDSIMRLSYLTEANKKSEDNKC